MNKLLSIILTSLYLSAAAAGQSPGYLQWDNTSPASEEDLLQDPLLILRTADRGVSSEEALSLACKRVSRCNFFDPTSASGINVLSIKPLENSQQASIDNEMLVTSYSPHFDHTKPTFMCASNIPWENIHWQVCETPDFSQVISTLDVIDPFSPMICISDLAETFLNNEQTYFFRAQGFSKSFHSAWSDPAAFTIEKPAAPKDVRIINDSTLTWQGSQESLITYLIFGSNSIDFVPSVYMPYQIDAMLDDAVTATSKADNFIGETHETKWVLNDRYAYYRVLAKSKGHFSNPSLLVYDYSIHPEQRNVLHHHCKGMETTGLITCRTPFPASYAWMQERSALGHAKYVRNPHVSEDIWNLLQDYFLPENHPAKPALDKIFSKNDALSSRSKLKKAGFDLLKHPQNRMIIAKHSKLKGYLVKAFLDSEPNTEWEWWKKRIDGARIIQAGIDKHGYHAFMKVPKKWIYPLTPREDSLKGQKKQFVLIVEDMNLQGSEEIRRSFKTKVTRELLDTLYVMITENLLIDSIFADNIPFSKDGRIAFVDTEHFNDTTQPLRLWMLAKYLSPEMHAYWDQVLFHGHPLTLSLR